MCAQEHSELQLTQCRERLVARTEQLLRLDAYDAPEAAGAGASASGVPATVAAAAAEVADELRAEREARQCVVCLRKERETAATELGRKLAKALAANPSVCWRVLIMALAESRSYEDRCGYSHYNARRKSAGQWREKLAPHMSQVKGTGLEIVDGADLGALWRDLAALDPAEPAKLLAALVADRVTVQSWRLGASTIAMAEELGLEVPAILLPEPEDEEDEEDGQTDLEDAIGERRSPDDMIDQAEAEAMSGA